jgi:hypothetical protein
MDDQERTPEHSHEPVQRPTPAPEREREIIISNGGGRGSGLSTAVVAIFAIIALLIVGFLVLTFIDREGGLLPDEIDVNIQVPQVSDGS